MIPRYRILCLVGYYLPGYKGGGPIRTISNLIEHLGEEFDFWIITRDRDMGDSAPYPCITNSWVAVGNARVFYASPGQLTLFSLNKIINSIDYDVLYLNSFFDPIFTLFPLLGRYLARANTKPVVLAPRGEFSAGALRLKFFKKYIYIKLLKFIKLYNNITWQASSADELQDILTALNIDNRRIYVASDIPTRIKNIDKYLCEDELQDRSMVRVVFLSRITPMKNLDYALQIMTSVCVNVVFDIYGPKEDVTYWKKCKKLIDKLPDNILCNYRGIVEPDNVICIFSKYDLLFLPTRGENFGHVIAESLSVGTPVLISDKTPWHNLKNNKLGEELSLDAPDAFITCIEKTYSDVLSKENYKLRKVVKNNALKHLNNPEVIDSNRNLFLSTVDQSSHNI